MPRIPYADEDRAPEEIVAPIRARRGGALLNLDRMLLHSPAFARGWNALLGAVRNELTLPPRLRELAICAVAAVNGDDYEWRQHAPALRDLGATQAQLDALRDVAAAAGDAGLFDATERAALGLALELARDGEVSDAAFDAARRALPDAQQLVELVAVISTFCMVSRFLLALGVEPEPSAGAAGAVSEQP
ncbi:MAG TPA: carboxymuconolactone decarboxylase family protein [Chloroflexaceae bacterium]|nr:carboxymuconolactone decarboxylase family protein [Chloroflexaceae bacterium]